MAQIALLSKIIFARQLRADHEWLNRFIVAIADKVYFFYIKYIWTHTHTQYIYIYIQDSKFICQNYFWRAYFKNIRI